MQVWTVAFSSDAYFGLGHEQHTGAGYTPALCSAALMFQHDMHLLTGALGLLNSNEITCSSFGLAKKIMLF